MPAKNLVLTINCHQPYIRHFSEAEKYTAENELFFNAISRTYLPLVNMFNRLEKDNVDFKIAFVLSPVLCSMLSDEFLQEQYLLWVDKRIALGEKELVRCKNDEKLLANAKRCYEQAKQEKTDFEEKYNRNLLKEFKKFAQKGNLELLATTGTALYIPHYCDMKEILNGQIETGIYSHKYYFGDAPQGFYVPQLAYAKGLDRILRSYGINYTITDPAAILFADNANEDGVFSPVRTHYSLVLFGKDRFCEKKKCFADHLAYKNVEKDIGFELSSEDLQDFLGEDGTRISTGYRYWANDGQLIYDESYAMTQTMVDAEYFIKNSGEKLEKAAAALKKDVCSIWEIDAEDLGQNWEEGIAWLENVIRLPKNFELGTCNSMLDKQFSLPRINPYPCSQNGSGYGEDLLDNSNSYMIRYLRKMCERIVDLAGRFTDETGLKVRLLNLGSRELMIAQDCCWAQMLHDGINSEYVQNVFKNCVLNFTAVFDSLGTNTVSTEWLTNLEKEHNLFPWMNYRIFSPKV